MTGIYAAFALAAKAEYSEEAEMEALTAMDRAYLFVYSFHHELDGMNVTEAEIRAAESQCTFCRNEIEFQLAFLSANESSQGLPPPYAKMISLL
jgi:hypothetical protein